MRRKIVEIEKVIRPPIKRARFYCRPGLEPVGYRCSDIEIMRKRGETIEELRTRSKDAVDWPSIETVHVFIPL